MSAVKAAKKARPAVGDSARAPEAADTRTRILDAAYRCLAHGGYTALSVREIAKDAGVNHALINYYFGTKDRLVIAVLDDANRRLLQRQRSMYASSGSFSEKWAQARRFYEDDLASGFVRVQAELYAASLSNPTLREQFLPRIMAWKQVVLEATREALRMYEPRLPQTFNAEAIATLISEFWLGMEWARLIGDEGEKTRHDAALDAVQQMLVTLESQGTHKRRGASVSAKPRAARRRSR